MSSEQERVHRIMQEKARGNQMGSKLKWDPATKQIAVTGDKNSSSKDLDITPEDMKFFFGYGG